MGSWVDSTPYTDMGDSVFEPIRTREETEAVLPDLQQLLTTSCDTENLP